MNYTKFSFNHFVVYTKQLLLRLTTLLVSKLNIVTNNRTYMFDGAAPHLITRIPCLKRCGVVRFP